MRFWVKPLLVLAAVWLVAGTIIFFAKSAKPTADSIVIYIHEHSLASANSSERAKIIEAAAEQMNRLEYAERQKLRQSRQLDGFYKEMNEEERGRFLDLTLPQGFRQMMQAFNKMESGRRKKFVEKAMADLEEHGPREDENMSEEVRDKIVKQGLSAFYEEASSEVKLDFAPLIEQMQRGIQQIQ